MGMLSEMFGDSEGNAQQAGSADSELLAKGNYTSDAGEILSGYKTFQKKYVYKRVAVKLLIVAVALVSSVMMLITSEPGDLMPFLCLLICIAAAVYFINEPVSNKKKVRNGVEAIQGAEYEAQIYAGKIVISTVGNADTGEEEASDDLIITAGEAENSGDGGMQESDEIPATVIHLDSPIVDFIERDDIFIVVIKKSYVFIIPKKAFSEDEVKAVSDKMKLILGIRYKSA